MFRLYAFSALTLLLVKERNVAAFEECIQLGDSISYTGNKSKTQSGLECQRWDSQTPHEHEYDENKMFPDHSVCKAKNYCRDPGNDGFLWCYTVDPNTRWESCGILWCDEPVRNNKTHDCYNLTAEDRLQGNTETEICESNPFRKSICGKDVPEGCETCVDCCQTKDCYYNMHGYTGTWHRTETGRECQRWDRQFPHKHGQTEDYKFDADGSVTAAHNYCRDPDFSGFLWCYSMDPNVRWEKCGIPLC